ncbi:hypothetical protein D931_02614 [Enterococcus faecium 13.SD.W.09]|nr:hypothetical protein D931_02614 [Enterococcus faecium 13.SD.W.09]
MIYYLYFTIFCFFSSGFLFEKVGTRQLFLQQRRFFKEMREASEKRLHLDSNNPRLNIRNHLERRNL